MASVTGVAHGDGDGAAHGRSDGRCMAKAEGCAKGAAHDRGGRRPRQRAARMGPHMAAVAAAKAMGDTLGAAHGGEGWWGRRSAAPATPVCFWHALFFLFYSVFLNLTPKVKTVVKKTWCQIR